jgi:hypothetical protein
MRCNLHGESRDSVELAQANWNTRPIEDKLKRELASAKAEIERLKKDGTK